jgi:hypothetical protein
MLRKNTEGIPDMDRRITRGAIFLLSAALVSGGCASGKKGGNAVFVAYDPGEVRGCAFLGRVTQTATESEPAGTGMLRQRTAEMGGTTLLVRPGGIGEAWDCAGRFHAYAPDTRLSPTRPVTGRYPTPPATPRY